MQEGLRGESKNSIYTESQRENDSGEFHPMPIQSQSELLRKGYYLDITQIS